MNFGFVIDNTRCIGCHACSTACKSEHDVPLGVSRTWVKYTEAGRYPDVRRHFQVTRCNHCANPPCARICPTGAMYQRNDGIVEFDSAHCIGCKACLQACPYDAIHIDPATNTAAKCNYCAHRLDIGLEPSCVVVCPEHAIISGDIDDSTSEISAMLARNNVTVRKPEQGTAPKLFYVDGHDIAMHPTAVPTEPSTFMWADVRSNSHGPSSVNEPGSHPRGPAAGGVGSPSIRTPGHQGLPRSSPIHMGQGRIAEQMVQVAYNQQHEVPWHWPVPAYLVTKGIAAGLVGLFAIAALFGLAPWHGPTAVAAGFMALFATALTAGLLVYDLEQPARFMHILLRPQWKSWLTRGAVILTGFSGAAALWWAAEAATWMGWVDAGVVESARPWLLGVSLPLAIGTAIYTAFLFGQAEGRDLWQSSLLPAHLAIQAAMAGAASLLLIALFTDAPDGLWAFARWSFGIALVVDLGVTLMGEFGMPHASEVAARAAHDIYAGRFEHHFWIGAIFVGHIVPLLLLAIGAPWAAAAGGVAALIGLYAFEHAFVMAPQLIANS